MLSFDVIILPVSKCYHFYVIIFPSTCWVLSFMLSFDVIIYCYHFPPFFFFLKTWHTLSIAVDLPSWKSSSQWEARAGTWRNAPQPCWPIRRKEKKTTLFTPLTLLSQTGFAFIWIWFFLFMYDIQHCFICRPSDSTVSEDAWIEFTVRNLFISMGIWRSSLKI